jgi:hypothetical protein
VDPRGPNRQYRIESRRCLVRDVPGNVESVAGSRLGLLQSADHIIEATGDEGVNWVEQTE